ISVLIGNADGARGVFLPWTEGVQLTTKTPLKLHNKEYIKELKAFPIGNLGLSFVSAIIVSEESASQRRLEMGKGDKKALDGEEKDLKEDEEEEEQEIEEFDDCVLISCQFEAFKLKDLIPRTAMWRSNKFT
ncbi:hypothetical protein ADUPG1_003677, partial [Aduncisulcus paluster]